MSCDCYKQAYLPIIQLLEKAADNMWFATPEFDLHQQRIHDIVQSMNMKFKCINRCYYD